VELHITLHGRGDLTARIYRQLRDAIRDGRLRPGERLPPTRELAKRLDVSRNTVAAAYDRLTAEGFLTGKVGSGTFVGAQPVRRARSAPKGGIQPRKTWRAMPGQVLTTPPRTAYDFQVGVPDGRLFPLETWRRLLAREWRATATRHANYGDPEGHPGVREAIARHIGVSRSVRAGADDVLVTQGAQQALDLIARVLLDPGSVVAVEEPGYPPARNLFQSLGAAVVGVPVDAEGIDVTALPHRTRLVYVTPSHQFPLGTPMSLARRTALLDWAQRHNAVIIEDDYDSEFRFTDRPLEPLQSLDRAGRVIYVGSFSKTLLPMLRLGFLVAPTSLRPALRLAKQLTDWHGDLLTQAALARFIDDGLLARHLRKATRVYASRHELIVGTLQRDFPELTPVPSVAGLHVCARAATDLDQVVRRAAAYGVTVRTLGRFCHDVPQPGLVIGYGAIQSEDLPTGLERLRASF